MIREEAIEHFRKNYVEELHIKKIGELRQYLENHYDEIEQELLEAFERLFRKISLLQKECRKGKVAYIILSVLRTSLLLDEGRCLLSAYDETWYADQKPVEEEYDGQWLFFFLNQYAHELNQESRKYIGKISYLDVERLKMDKLEPYKAFLVALCKKNINKIVTLSEIVGMDKFSTFNIRIGEYMDLTESLWLVNENMMNNEDMRLYFNNKFDWAYVYKHFKDFDLSSGDYSSINMSYTRYENVNFNSSMLRRCVLTGTRFTNCQLEKADLTESLINESDFSKSQMKDAVLRGAYIGEEAGIKGGNDRLFIATKFIETDLTNADLSYGNFYQCDFRGAILEGCDFTQANLIGAIMDAKYRCNHGLNLTERQRGDIIWE